MYSFKIFIYNPSFTTITLYNLYNINAKTHSHATYHVATTYFLKKIHRTQILIFKKIF